jgi:phosphatidylglycerophosphatase A
MKFLARFLATAGYIGYAPAAPGTAGSLVALPIIWLAYPALSPAAAVFSVSMVFLIAVWSAGRQAGEQEKDPQHVVIDELVGQLIAMLVIPVGIFTIAAGFVLFRMFDVFKPFPSRQSEKLPGGWGIVMDDVVAGIYANIGVRLVVYFF